MSADATRPEVLAAETAGADLVVSLLPAPHHVAIARACLDRRVSLVTTSYVSDEMQALDADARSRGILLLNEMGLDPGIDHMTAVSMIRDVQRLGGRVVSFSSCCGAIPAPDSNTNPWGYKFAWSPRGVVLAARNPVRYLERGEVVERAFPDFFDRPRILHVPGAGRLEAYPNRNCLRYREAYGLSEALDFFRGTLRHPGWCETWHALFDVGLLGLEPRDFSGSTCAEFLAFHLPPGPGSLRDRLARRIGVDAGSDVVSRFEWIGLLSDERLLEGVAAPLDVLTRLLESRLRYAEGEHDMVVLEHQCVAAMPDGTLRRITGRMVVVGAAGDDSALARTVSHPAAIACRLLLAERVDLTGVRIPVDPEIAVPALRALRERGLRFEETTESVE